MKNETKEIKWLQLDNRDGTGTLKQHAFAPRECKKPITREPYIGNRSLCGKIVCGNENEEIEAFDLVESEPLNENEACKACMKESKKELTL